MSLQPFQPLDDTGRWIIHKAPDIEPAWALEKALEKHKIPPASQRLDQRKNGFQAFIHTFLSSHGDQEAYIAFRSATSWEDVRQEAEQAVDQYVNQGNTWNSPFRRTKRLFGSTASRLEFLTQLIPNGDYLGVLCGGLKLAYNAANRNKQLREIILGALESLDSEINFTKILIREYAWDENVRKTTEDLYVAILDAVEAIVKWIEKRKGFRGILQAGKAIARQNDYGSELEAQVSTNIKEKVEAFERAVRTCLSIDTRAIATNLVTVGKTLDIVDGKIDKTVGELGRVAAAGYTVEDLLRGMRHDMMEWMERDRRDKESLAASQESIRQMLQAQQTQRIMAGIKGSETSPNSYSLGYPTIIPQHLLQALNLVNTPCHDIPSQIIHQTSSERDLIFYFGPRLPPQSHRAISTVLQHAHFTTWSNPNSGSSTLLINGFDLDFLNLATSNGGISPWSYLCAMLARTVSELPSIYTTAFFCRLHSDPTSTNDPILGPSGLLRSIIGQLILQHPNPAIIPQCLLTNSNPNMIQLLQGIQRGSIQDFSSLCVLLDQVLHSFISTGPAMIICTIDGASFFESEYHLAQMDGVMRYLDSLIRAVSSTGNRGLMFKLLVTSPTMVENGRNWFSSAVQLDVPAAGEFLGGIEGLEPGSQVLLGLAERAVTPVSPGAGGSFTQGGSP